MTTLGYYSFNNIKIHILVNSELYPHDIENDLFTLKEGYKYFILKIIALI